MTSSFAIEDGFLRCGELDILAHVPPTVHVRQDRTGNGAFLQVKSSLTAVFWRSELGELLSVDRFAVCHRQAEPFWMVAGAGGAADVIPPDTQWLLLRRTDGRLVLIVPILDAPLRFSLDGRGGKLAVWGDTGENQTVCREGTAVFIALGEDVYELQARGARAVVDQLGTATARNEKPLPDFADLFGWCTWDAFYQDVNVDKIRHGLQGFRAGGVTPGFLLLDDGWLAERTMPNGGRRLTAFHANPDKFPGGLRALKRMLVDEFGLQRLIVWHAMMGYWAGVDTTAFSCYDAHEQVRQTLPSFGRDYDPLFSWYGLTCGMVPPNRIAEFFEAFHAALAADGVDGVKVDNQSSLEFSGTGQGGRMALNQAYRAALEASCHRHFGGRLINCMANANETYYLAGQGAGLMRTSTDFWPGIPSSHGLHLYTNAMVSLWFGEFMHPDWDMFQSGHQWGAFHAAARAISGSPVYVSDKVGEHDFDLLRQLVCATGVVPRCIDIARPSPECVFHDPTREDVALKLFNRNQHGWVLGVFNARYDADQPVTVNTVVSLRDLPGLPPGEYAVYAHRRAELCPAIAAGGLEMSLAQGEWELFTITPVVNGIAVIGDPAMLNSGGCLIEMEHLVGRCRACLRGGGTLLAARFEATGNGKLVSIQPDEGGWCEISDAGNATKE